MYTPAVVNATSFRVLLAALAGRLKRQQNEVITYLIAEPHPPRLATWAALRLTDDERAGRRDTSTGWAAEGIDWEKMSGPFS